MPGVTEPTPEVLSGTIDEEGRRMEASPFSIDGCFRSEGGGNGSVSGAR
jgi:hypothetical protein